MLPSVYVVNPFEVFQLCRLLVEVHIACYVKLRGATVEYKQMCLFLSVYSTAICRVYIPELITRI